MSDKNLKKIRVINVIFYSKQQFIEIEPTDSKKTKVLATLESGDKLCVSRRSKLLITFANNGRPDNYDLYPFLKKHYPKKKISDKFLADLQQELIGNVFLYDGENIFGLDPILAKLIKKK